MNKKIESTYDKFIRSLSSEDKKDFDRGREAFLISEMVLAAMQQDYTAVRELAEMAGISAEVIHDIIPQPKTKFDLNVFFRVLKSLGYRLVIERNDSRVPLASED